MNKKLRISFKHLFLFFLIAAWFYSLTEPLYTPTAIPVDKDLYFFPEVVAYNGLTSDDFPGNSLSALKQALSSQVDGIKVDVRQSKDGVLFLYQGDRLDELTDHKGIPEHYDWSFLSQVKYKNTPEKLVLLDDFLTLVGNKKSIFIAIKSPNIIETEIVHRLADAIKAHHLQENVFVESFNPLTLAILRVYRRDIMLVYDFVQDTDESDADSQEIANKMPWLLKRSWVQKQIRRIIRPDVLAPRVTLSPHAVQDLVHNGYPLISWTVDDPQRASLLYALGVKGVQSKKPLLIKNKVLSKTMSKTIADVGGETAIVQNVINVTDITDIQKGIHKAKKERKTISIGGRRHSMGGQTLCDKAIFLNMLNFNDVTYHPATQTVTAQAGATWKKIQEVLATHGRSVKIMQSDNIFTVGGSISVNVHGWQVGAPPLSSTLLSMTVITADGQVHTVSPTLNPELFSAIIGGYGLFGVIVEAELETVPNSLLEFHTFFTDIEHFNQAFDTKVTQNKKTELAYARLSVDKDHFLDKAGLFWFETKNANEHKREITPEQLVSLKRGIFRFSEYSDLAKKVRWSAEKFYAKRLEKENTPLTRNDAMNTDSHILWPLYGDNKDILHEYFIPKKHFSAFINKLKACVHRYAMNLLNVTIREVKKDDRSLLAYAKEDVFGLVCLFSQDQTLQDEERMKRFTQDVIEEAIALEGTFYLPYRPHYTAVHLLAAYPNIEGWIDLKKKYDPGSIFQSKFFQYLYESLKKGAPTRNERRGS